MMTKTLWEIWRICDGGACYAPFQFPGNFWGGRLDRDDLRSLDKDHLDDVCKYLNELADADERYEVWDALTTEAKIALMGIENRVYPNDWRRAYDFRADETD